MNTNEPVTIKKTVLSGTIKKTAWDDLNREFKRLVEYFEDGELHQRWFHDSELEEIKDDE